MSIDDKSIKAVPRFAHLSKHGKVTLVLVSLLVPFSASRGGKPWKEGSISNVRTF